ncbi:hypothetical protein ACHAW6_000103 [Cyclotella cf. meneghiniana]
MPIMPPPISNYFTSPHQWTTTKICACLSVSYLNILSGNIIYRKKSKMVMSIWKFDTPCMVYLNPAFLPKSYSNSALQNMATMKSLTLQVSGNTFPDQLALPLLLMILV